MVIAVLSLIPGYKLPEASIKYADLIVHVVMYGGWMLVIGIERMKQYSGESKRYMNRMLLTVVTFGLMIEVVQELLVQGRFGSISDGVANTLGASLVYLIFARVDISRK